MVLVKENPILINQLTGQEGIVFLIHDDPTIIEKLHDFGLSAVYFDKDNLQILLDDRKNAPNIVDSLDNNKIIRKDHFTYNPKFRGFVIVFDSDYGPQRTAAAYEKIMDDEGIKVYNFKPYGSYNGINEALENNPEALKDELEEIVKDPEAYKRKTSSSFYRIPSMIEKINERRNDICYTTGFETLDKILNGGFTGTNLTVLAAPSSLGKSAFLLQLACNAAEAGKDVLYFTLEMSQDEMICRCLSRYTALINGPDEIGEYKSGQSADNIFKGNFIKDKKQVDLINRAIESFSGIAKNLYFEEGNFDFNLDKIEEVINKHIIMTGKKPIVFIDYLQVIAPSEKMRLASDKQIVDTAVKTLKKTARALELPIVAISSLNRMAYSTDQTGSQATMANLKESGSLEYTADTCLMMSEFKRVDFGEKIIKISIPKLRAGRKNQEIYFDYFPEFNLFREHHGEIDGVNKTETRKDKKGVKENFANVKVDDLK